MSYTPTTPRKGTFLLICYALSGADTGSAAIQVPLQVQQAGAIAAIVLHVVSARLIAVLVVLLTRLERRMT